MKKGERRKANRAKNRPAKRRAGHHKPKGQRPNPLFGAMDQKAMRRMVNQAIGAVLIDQLGIDFVGMMEKAAERDVDTPTPPESVN